MERPVHKWDDHPQVINEKRLIGHGVRDAGGGDDGIRVAQLPVDIGNGRGEHVEADEDEGVDAAPDQKGVGQGRVEEEDDCVVEVEGTGQDVEG